MAFTIAQASSPRLQPQTLPGVARDERRQAKAAIQPDAYEWPLGSFEPDDRAPSVDRAEIRRVVQRDRHVFCTDAERDLVACVSRGRSADLLLSHSNACQAIVDRGNATKKDCVDTDEPGG